MTTPVVVCGPTGAGKSAFALELAVRWDAIVVSMDAMAVYRGLDIGTAKPSASDRQRVPHLGLDVVEPTQHFDAADFVRLAIAAVDHHPRVIICGGTHLYLRALHLGLSHTPPVSPTLRSAIERENDLHGWLQRVDPKLAARLHPNDRVRLVRGLEVFLLTGRRLSDLHAEQVGGREVLAVWVDHADLDARLKLRTEEMLAAGWLAEVESLLERGVPRDCRPMRGLGYRNLVDVVNGLCSLSDATNQITIDTRRFAKKQRTWRNHFGWPVSSQVAADLERVAHVAWEVR